MDDFQFSLWFLDKDFFPSLAILVFGGFAVSFTFTKLVTSRLVHDALNGQSPRTLSKKRRELVAVMKDELEALCCGRTYDDLEKQEQDEFKQIRDFYYSQINRLNR